MKTATEYDHQQLRLLITNLRFMATKSDGDPVMCRVSKSDLNAACDLLERVACESAGYTVNRTVPPQLVALGLAADPERPFWTYGPTPQEFSGPYPAEYAAWADAFQYLSSGDCE